jgi:hypothetical protein
LGWGLRKLQVSKNFLGDGLRVLQHVVIPKPHDPYSQSIKLERPLAIVFGVDLSTMLPSVQFHGQSTGGTVEVENISGDSMLPAKPVARDASKAKDLPKFRFRIRRLPPHVAGEVQVFSVTISRDLHEKDGVVRGAADQAPTLTLPRSTRGGDQWGRSHDCMSLENRP